MLTTRMEFIVRYAETDAQGIAHHANYLVWFEEGRSDFLRQQGLAYSEMERQGYLVVVAGIELTCRAPAFYEDVLVLSTTLARIRSRGLEFSYRLHNRHNILLAEGRSRHVIIGRDRRPTALSEAWLGALRSGGTATGAEIQS